MTFKKYRVRLAPPAKRAISSKLPPDVAVGAIEFINGPIAENPYRVGKELDRPFEGVYSARLMRDWRVLYTIDEKDEIVAVQNIRHRADAYRVS